MPPLLFPLLLAMLISGYHRHDEATFATLKCINMILFLLMISISLILSFLCLLHASALATPPTIAIIYDIEALSAGLKVHISEQGKAAHTSRPIHLGLDEAFIHFFDIQP